MGFWDRFKDRKKNRTTQSSSATGSLDTSVSTSSAQQARDAAIEKAKAEVAAEKAAQLAAAQKAEQERLAQEAAAAEAEKQRAAAAASRQQAATNAEAAKSAVNTPSAVISNIAGTKSENDNEVKLDEFGNPIVEGPIPSLAISPMTADASVTGLAETGLSTLGSGLDSAVSFAPAKTPAELQAERDAAADARAKANSSLLSSLSAPKEEAPSLLAAQLSSQTTNTVLSDPAAAIMPTASPMLMSAPAPAVMSVPSIVSEPVAAITEPVAALEPTVKVEPLVNEPSTGLAEGTTRLFENIYETPTADVPELLSTEPALAAAPMAIATEPLVATAALPEALSAEPAVATLLAPTTLSVEGPSLLTEEGTAPLTTEPVIDAPTTESIINEALPAAADITAEAVVEAPVSYEPASTIGSGNTLLTGGLVGGELDPVVSSKIEQGIGNSGSTVESYNTTFDSLYADYFVDESLSLEEANALLDQAPTTTLKDVRTDTRSYNPSSKVANLLEQGGLTMNAKGGMTYVPEGDGFTLDVASLEKIAEQRKLRQAKGLPIKEEGPGWKLDENGNVIAKVVAKPMSYRGSTGVNAGAAGGAGKHGWLKGTKAQKKAIAKNYKRRGGKLLTTGSGTGFAVDMYDDADNTWDVYGYDLATAAGPGSMTPRFFESTDRAKAQKVYDTWLKAYQVKYQGATPAQRATAQRQAKGKAKQQIGAARATAQRKVAQQTAAKKAAVARQQNNPSQRVLNNIGGNTNGKSKSKGRKVGVPKMPSLF